MKGVWFNFVGKLINIVNMSFNYRYFFKSPFWFFIFLAGLLLILYSNNLTAFFVSDDFDWIVVSRSRAPWEFFVANYTGQSSGGSYAPVVNLIFYFLYQLGGLRSWPYHLFSLICHFGNLILIFVITRQIIFQKFKQNIIINDNRFLSLAPYLATLIFTVYFNNSEAVSWIAAMPHLVATFFCLLTIWYWLKYLDQFNLKFFFYSLISFSLALLTKDIALVLPAVLLILFLVERPPLTTPARRGSWNSSSLFFKKWLMFLVVIGIYLALRYWTTGLLFGYYNQQHLSFSVINYWRRFLIYLAVIFTSGSWRSQVILIITNYWSVFSGLLFIILGWIIWLFKQQWRLLILSLVLFGSLVVIYLPLSFNPLNNEGERYLYLPLSILAIILSLLLIRLPQKFFWIGCSLFFVFFISSVTILYQKNNVWRQSAEISQKIIQQIGQIPNINDNPQKLIFLYSPDNLAGAQIFRNARKEAIDLFYPKHQLTISAFQTYINLTPKNKDQSLITWRPQNKGVLGKINNQQKILTGLARQESDELIFELWGYDYEKFITDTIYVGFKPKLKALMQTEPVWLTYFDEGKLKFLTY